MGRDDTPKDATLEQVGLGRDVSSMKLDLTKVLDKKGKQGCL